MSDTTKGGGIGFARTLGIVFIALKLIGKIDWSWWWVLAPLWIPLAGVAIFATAVCVLIWKSEYANKRFRERLRQKGLY